jgi:SAM-dependent methyltransferase
VSEALFDLTEEYQAMLDQGIRLSGENMFFFLEGRLALLQRLLRARRPPARILDFGCGLGYAARRLRELFPDAEVTGADTSENALQSARERNGTPGVRFHALEDLEREPARFDVCYVNGVFHHIPLAERASAMALIHRVLRPGGVLALFENNPWNPGARMVMARIPFDRDAHMLSPLQTAALMKRAEFDVLRTESLFFFPRPLKALRRAEPYLSWTRLGAQYAVIGVRP